MNKRYAIFDLDGTLLDSMGWWKGLSEEFLRSRGVTELPDGLLDQIKTMTVLESADLFIRTCGISGTEASVAEEINALMDRHYREDISLKLGVKSYLERLKAKGVRMCVASATSAELIAACLRRLESVDYFEGFFSCEDIGAGKTRPDIYLKAAAKMGARPEDTAVYEDALYAAETAKKAGFYVVGVYDKDRCQTEEERKYLEAMADEIIENWEEEE
ncbi:MAG: HAD family phosphatase [Clostridium sp.]|nr:HAD family phosphatase [Clostridium sp.]